MNDEQWQAFQEGFAEAYDHARLGTPMKRIEVSFSTNGAIPWGTFAKDTVIWNPQPEIQVMLPSEEGCAHAAGLRNLGSQAVCWECGEAFALIEMRPARS